MHHSKREESSTKRGTVWVGQCRVNHYYGTTANQYAQLSADGLKPRFAFIFYTAAWFAIEQRAIRNATGWAMPEAYLDDADSSSSSSGKEMKLVSLLRAEHPNAAIAVLTDDIQSDKLRSVLPSARHGNGDAARVEHVTNWMERRELQLYSRADATVTVSAHDSAWMRKRLKVNTHPHIVMCLPFIAYPPPPRQVPGFAARSGMLYCGVAHTSAAQSMRWFLSAVHPHLQSLLRAKDDQANSRLTIVGWGWKDLKRDGPGCSHDSDVRGRGSRCVGSVLQSSSNGSGGGDVLDLLDLHHAVDDEVLSGIFAARRVFIAPCRGCTGVATKVVTALRHGIPVVCTSEATRGIIDGPHHAEISALSVHDDPEAFAAAVAALLTDEELWRRKSEAALRFTRVALSENVLDTLMGSLLTAVEKG